MRTCMSTREIVMKITFRGEIVYVCVLCEWIKLDTKYFVSN